MSFGDTNTGLQPYQNRQFVATVSLSRLVDFSIQRTFHELIVLTELLPRKSDIERKIEIVSFANRTRQLFIRLLALVKWAGSASKVEKCSTIVSFLDKQSMLFTETADILAKMSRETLVQARLPCFQLPCAVEVLTLGTYSRLPSCIRDRIVPPDSINSSERRSTLMRLDHIIQQRLVTSHLPQQMRNLKIEYGRVVFHVDHEFELTMTCMGDSPLIPWRVLQIDILVEDKETGEGKDLVHPLQISFLHHLVQTRLTDSQRPLYDVYGILHSFCLSLQLEVLHAQSIRLSRERLGDFIRIEEYIPGKRLYLSYWRDHLSEFKSGCKICLEIDGQNPSKPLQVSHFPELSIEGTTFTNQAIKSDHLSVEKLLIHATHERAKDKLSFLQRQLQQLDIGECFLSGSPPILQVSYLKPCMLSEKLFVSVDSLTGSFLAHIPLFEDCPIVEELLHALKTDVSKTGASFKKLRIFILKERFKKTAEMLPVQVKESLPFSSTDNGEVLESPAAKLYLQFSRHHKNYLLVIFEEMNSYYIIKPKYYLLFVNPVSLENVEQQTQFEAELPKIYLQLTSILEIDITSIIRPKDADYLTEPFSDKRKLIPIECPELAKKPKVSGFFIPEFAHLITFCEEKLAYGALSCELQRRKICHQVRTSEEPVFSLFVDIIQFPPDSMSANCKLRNNLLSFTIRLQGKNSKILSVSLTFSGVPLPTQSQKDYSSRGVVYLMYDFSTGSQSQIVQMVDELIEDWTAISKLYDIVCDFAPLYNTTSATNSLEVKSYSYKKLVLGYGPSKNYTVSIRWKSCEKRYQLCFGISGNVTTSNNPHVLVSTQLQHEFNQHTSIAALIQNLNSTLNPLLTVQNLTSMPLLGVLNSRPQVPVQTFAIIPQSSTHIRLIYRNIYCVDITFLDELVAIRDGAYSLFDKVKVLEELTPIQGLKAFLNKFVDKSATQMRRLSQTEDDNPPSPVAQFESVEAYLFQAGQTKTASPLSMQSATDNSLMGSVSAPGMRSIHQPLNPGSMGSNPNTPSSPHTSMLTQSGYVASPNTTFPLASPPSHSLSNLQTTPQGQISASPSIQPVSHPEPSPANIFSGNSPGNPLHAPSPSFLPMPSPSASTSTHLQSPASNFITGQASHDPSMNSPFQAQLSMPSPHSVAWPGSPSIQRPSPSRPYGSAQSPVAGSQTLSLGTSPQGNISQHYHIQTPMSSTRLLPQRSWAAAIPTLLTQQGFENMCRPHAPVGVEGMPVSQLAHNNNVYSALSQLERFLGCVFMRRNLQRVIQGDENFSLIRTPEPGIIQFKNETMQFKISLHPTTMQSLHMKIVAVPEFKNQWCAEELDILERFFESKVVCAPYKPNAFLAYGRLLNTPIKILKDCIQLMRIEMVPERTFKWTIQLCLTIPPSAQVMLGSPGMSAIFIHKSTTMLFFVCTLAAINLLILLCRQIQFTRVSINLPVGIEPKSIVVPFVYDISRNSFQVAGERRDPSFAAANPIVGMINNLLMRCSSADYMQTGDCCIYPSIREVISSDLIP